MSRSKNPGSNSQKWVGVLFSIPYVLVFLFGTIAPLVYAAYLGLFSRKLIGGTVFTGLSNYVKALMDPILWSSYKRVAVYTLIQVPVMLVMAVIAALMLDSGRIKHLALPRMLLFLPYAVPSVIAALMWSYMYGTQYGLVGQVSAFFGIHAPDLLSQNLILLAIGNVQLWCFMGYNMLIYFSSLKVIPEELYEAARIDGASELRIAWSIKLRQIRGTVVMTMVFGLIGGLQLFNEPNLLRIIVPDVISSSFTPNMYAYRLSFASQNINYAAAVALIVGLIAMLLIGIVKKCGDRWAQE